MTLPLRYVLRYDPVFIELGYRIKKNQWGSLHDGRFQGVLKTKSEKEEIVAFLFLLFQKPDKVKIQKEANVLLIHLTYPSFNIEGVFSVASEGLPEIDLQGRK